MKTETAEQAKLRREADAARKRKQRAAAKEANQAAALQNEMKAAETVEQFWAVSIKAADPTKLAAWKERQERVFDQMYYIEQHVKGIYDVRPDEDEYFVSVEEGDEDLRADLTQHGHCAVYSVLRLGKFWQNPSRMARFARREDATSIFARFGILTAVPDHTVEDWDDYVKGYRLRDLPPTPGQGTAPPSTVFFTNVSTRSS